jgi:hypothetical protein
MLRGVSSYNGDHLSGNNPAAPWRFRLPVFG